MIKKQQVKDTFLNIVNDGRPVKVKLSDHTSPSQAMERLTDDDLKKFNVLGLFNGISANDYTVKMSMLWTSLFWKIGEQILIVGNYNTPFHQFYKELEIGGDIEEVAPRIKDGLDRNSLSNSALFTNYVTQYDSFYHRLNQFKVFASTYDQYEIQRISNSWSNLTNMLNAELENIIKSSSVYLNNLSKEAFATQYLSGGMDIVELEPMSSEFNIKKNAVLINTIIDDMTLEASDKYIPFNKNTNVGASKIVDLATSDIYLVATSELLNNIEFMTTLNTYFQGTSENDKFKLNTIKISSIPSSISPNIEVTPGYTPLTGASAKKKVLGFLIEENGMIFREKSIGTFNFDNAATLKTSIFRHLDALANISDRRKVCAIVEK